MNNAVVKCGLIGFGIFCVMYLLSGNALSILSSIDSIMWMVMFSIPGLLLGAFVGLLFRKKTGSSSSNSKMNDLDKIAELKKLLDSGALTQEEFDRMKKEILK